MTRLLVTTGPESCGKTTLAAALSFHLDAPLVDEVARDYLTRKYQQDPLYQYDRQDLLAIAQLQHAAEQQALAKGPELLICDTDLLVLIVWSEVRYGAVDAWIVDTFLQSAATSTRTFLLCDHRIPWQADPLREHADSRDQLYTRYLAKLRQWQLPYQVIQGTPQQRLELALHNSGLFCTKR